jgi:hypothetical protein
MVETRRPQTARQADYSWAQTRVVYADEWGTSQTAAAPPVGSSLAKRHTAQQPVSGMGQNAKAAARSNQGAVLKTCFAFFAPDDLLISACANLFNGLIVR